MQPTLRPGEHVLVATWPLPRVGDVVVLRDPEWTSTFTVKRITAVDVGGYEVRGDNVNVSRDSRHFGKVPRRLIVGRVIVRYGL